MSVCEEAEEFCPEDTSPPEPSEVESMFDSEDEESSAGENIPSLAEFEEEFPSSG